MTSQDQEVRLFPVWYIFEEALMGLTSGLLSRPPEEQVKRKDKILLLIRIIQRSQEVTGSVAHKLWLLCRGIPLIFEAAQDTETQGVILLVVDELEERVDGHDPTGVVAGVLDNIRTELSALVTQLSVSESAEEDRKIVDQILLLTKIVHAGQEIQGADARDFSGLLGGMSVTLDVAGRSLPAQALRIVAGDLLKRVG